MRAAYSASKHGIRGITRSSALDWAARGIRINELQPGVIDTPMLTHGGEQENAQIVAHIAAKRMGLGREIATAVAFLLSEDASYVVGAHLAVDGGFLA
jgi:NAD(P)-dependent dehydrogenase (short-subunit alcohol dehydrogenase family)